MKHLTYLFLFLVLFVGCKDVPKEQSDREFILDHDKNKVLTTAETIAYKNGFEAWKEVKQIDFKFNVAREGKTLGGRKWSWKPKRNEVSLLTETDTITFNRATLDSITTPYDANFINDKYWLLAPFNLIWDEGTKFSEKENQIAPISKDTLNMLTITYSKKGGYTPGDAYDFYYGKDFMIKEWVFRKSNSKEMSMQTTWEDYQTFKGIVISKSHKDPASNLELFFTDINVQ